MQGSSISCGQDHSAAAAEDPDMAGAPLAEQLVEVGEELVVATLVRGDGNPLGVLLQDRVDDLVDRPIVAEVDDLGAFGLGDPPHDVDRRVVTVEQGGRGHDADLVAGAELPVVGRRGGSRGRRRL